MHMQQGEISFTKPRFLPFYDSKVVSHLRSDSLGDWLWSRGLFARGLLGSSLRSHAWRGWRRGWAKEDAEQWWGCNRTLAAPGGSDGAEMALQRLPRPPHLETDLCIPASTGHCPGTVPGRGHSLGQVSLLWLRAESRAGPSCGRSNVRDSVHTASTTVLPSEAQLDFLPSKFIPLGNSTSTFLVGLLPWRSHQRKVSETKYSLVSAAGVKAQLMLIISLHYYLFQIHSSWAGHSAGLSGSLVRWPRPSHLRESQLLITKSLSGHHCCIYLFTLKTGQRSSQRHPETHGHHDLSLSVPTCKSSPISSW